MNKRSSSPSQGSKDYSELRSIEELGEAFSTLHEEIVCLLNSDHKPKDTEEYQEAIADMELALIKFRKGLHGSRDTRTVAECSDLMNRAERLSERLEADKSKAASGVTTTLVCLFVGPYASYSLAVLFFPAHPRITRGVPVLVAGAGFCWQHQFKIKKAWLAAKEGVTATTKVATLKAKKGLTSLKVYGQNKKAVVQASFRECKTVVSQRAKAVPQKTRKLINKIRGVGPS